MSDAHQPAPPPDDAPGQRLSKVVAALKRCSRRAAEQYIAEGWVQVDGQRADEPQVRVHARQQVQIDPAARLQLALAATFLVNKPAGVEISTVADAAAAWLTEAAHWQADASGIRRSRAHLGGLQVLLPLPVQASGLCVVSQDFRVVRKLTEDAAFMEQELLADVAGTPAPGGLERLGPGTNKPLVRHGRPLPPARVSWQSEGRLRFAVKGIAPGNVAWMCAQIGLELTALRRIRIGRVPMAGLPLGQWCYLPAGVRF